MTCLNARRLVQAVSLHVDNLARLTVNAPRVFAVCVFGLHGGITDQSEQKSNRRLIHTRSSVRTLMALPPAFCTSVRGMTSIASATARYGQPSTPVILRALAWRPTLMAISVAPPPGARMGLNTTLRATDIASARLRSISLRMSFDGPRRRMVHAFGVVHSVRKVKYL